MGLGPSNSKKLIGQQILLTPKESKKTKESRKFDLDSLHGTLIDSKNGIHYIEIENMMDNEPKIIAIAASEYNSSTEMDAENTEAAAAAAETAAIAAEETTTPAAEEPAPAMDKTTITEEEMKPVEEEIKKGGKLRKSKKSQHKKKQRKSRRNKGTYGSFKTSLF